MLPGLQFLNQIQQQILSIPNKRKESKKKEHYCCYLLCQKAGLRVSEAINFDLSAKTHKGLYRLNKTKGKKSRLAYIPKPVINELKKYGWKPKQTNRFNFYHFLRKIKQELNIPSNTELTPHTLRRAFATYHAENGLPLPLLSKMLGHANVRTTALYWINTYHGGDDDDSDVGAILAGKEWLENDPEQPEMPAISEITPQPERINLLIEPEKQKIDELTNALSLYQQQLSEKDKKINELIAEKETLQSDLEDLSEQKHTFLQEKHQIQQNLAKRDQTIKQLEQELASEQAKRIATEDNSNQEKQTISNLRQKLQTERETNANLTQKLHAYEQNYSNLKNSYQIALRDKQTEKQRADHYEQQLQTIAKTLHQWQKIYYYQQLEKERNELKAQIIQPNFKPPPFK